MSNSNIEMNNARNSVYQLLSSLFAKEINRAMLEELNGDNAQAFWAQLATQPEFEHYVKTIVDTLANLNTDDDLLELAADYCGLFLVGNKHSASPYASLYIGDKEPTIFGPQHQQMLTFLQEKQLQLHSDFSEPADHIAVILAYAGHLSLSADEAHQLSYLKMNLANWLSHFVAQVEKTDQGVFYTAVAKLTLAWVNSEIEWFS